MMALRQAGAALALGRSQTGAIAAAAIRCAPCVVRHIHASRAGRWSQNDKNGADANAAADEANKDGLKSAEELYADLNEASESLKKLQELIEKEKAKAEDFKDKYVRALAETENVRKRSRQEIEGARQFAIQKFAASLLQVSDVFQLGLDSVSAAELEGNDALKNLHKGMEMTRDELHKVFKQFGIEKMEPLGTKFDPNAHEALFEVPDPSKEPGTVAVVQKTGYTLNGRTLRAAVVGVVRDPNA